MWESFPRVPTPYHGASWNATPGWARPQRGVRAGKVGEKERPRPAAFPRALTKPLEFSGDIGDDAFFLLDEFFGGLLHDDLLELLRADDPGLFHLRGHRQSDVVQTN